LSNSPDLETDVGSGVRTDVIDFHVHGFAPGMLPMEYYRGQAAQMHARRPSHRSVDELAERIQANAVDPSGEDLIRELDDAGINHAVIVGIDWAYLSADPPASTHPDAHLRYFEGLAGRARGRLSAILGVDPRRPDAAQIIQRAFKRSWVRGIKLYPPVGFSPLDRICDPVYQNVLAAGRFVMFHTGGQTYPFDLGFARLEQYGALQARYPELRIVLAHAGHPLWGPEALMVARGHPLTYLDVSGWHEEPPEVSSAFLRRCFDTVGPSRVLFGSDFVAGAYSVGRGHIKTWRAIFESAAADFGVPAADQYAAARLLVGDPRTSEEPG
jgi:uncharacterized protein